MLEGAPSHIENSKEIFKIRESIQLELINRYFGFKVQDNAHLMEWIKQYGSDYAQAFKEVQNLIPDLVAEYQERPEEVVSQIEEKLKEIHVHA